MLQGKMHGTVGMLSHTGISKIAKLPSVKVQGLQRQDLNYVLLPLA